MTTTYRGWLLDFEYGYHTATHPEFEASYEGPEDGWVGSHPTLAGRTLDDLKAEVDAWIEENDPDAAAEAAAEQAEYRADQARDRAMIERWEREQGDVL